MLLVNIHICVFLLPAEFAMNRSTSSDLTDDFMKELKDNFLKCQLCNNDFDRPKTLPCLHTFCQECLLKHAGNCSPVRCSNMQVTVALYTAQIRR